MREFTAKEKKTCKKIAEKEKRKIQCGDYAVVEFPRLGEKVILIDTQWEKQEKGIYNYSVDEVYPNYYSIWQEYDCWKWLKERQWKIEYWHENLSENWIEIGIVCCFPDSDLQGKKIFRKGKTVLEILQSFVLAILEEK